MEGFGDGFFDFLDNIEKVVGKVEDIKQGKHLDRVEGYKHQKLKFEEEDEMSV